VPIFGVRATGFKAKELSSNVFLMRGIWLAVDGLCMETLMRKLLFVLLGSSVMILMSSAYVITRLQLGTSPQAVSKKNQPSSRLLQVEKTIERLNLEIAELKSLESKIHSASLDEALASGIELSQKIKQYGPLQSLQSELQALNEMKAEYQTEASLELKTSDNEGMSSF
jgi:hypothetical protein